MAIAAIGALAGGGAIAAGVGMAASMYTANKAGKAGVRAANSQLDVANRAYETARFDTEPYREIGTGAIYRLGKALGIPGLTQPQHISDKEAAEVLTPQQLLVADAVHSRPLSFSGPREEFVSPPASLPFWP